MVTAKLTSKGQITVPWDVRERLGLRSGDAIEFVEDGGGFRIQKHVDGAPFEPYVGYLKALAGRDSDGIVRELRGE